jgi:photosystem II stability/assembly factor-like uncharacterized protein
MLKTITLSFVFCICTLQIFAQAPSINSSYFQVMSARALGPSTMSGRITSIEGMVVDGQINLYVGTAGGGIWKTQNGGLSFEPIFDKYCQSIGAIAVEPNNTKIVYAGTGESNMRNSVSIGDGMYKTSDGGKNWQRIGLDSTEHISKIIIDPSDKKTLYVAVPGPLWKSSNHRGLYKSTNGGKSWEKILFIDNETGCADIAMHPSNPNILFASFWQFRRNPYSFISGGKGSGLFKSIDGGKNWIKITNGFPETEMGRIVVTINPSKPKEILAIVEAKTPGLFQSQDEGETWKKLAATDNITARPFYFSTLVFDPKDSKKVYRPAFDFQYSNDGGFSWSNIVIGGVNPHADHHALWVNPEQPNILFLGTDGGVYTSINKGVSWQFLNNLPVGQFYHASVDKQEPYHVYGGLQDNGSWFAPSESPGGISSIDWKDINGGDGFWVQSNPFNSKIVFAESQGGNANRINLSDGLSTSIKPQKGIGEEEHRWNWNTPIVIGNFTKQANTKKLYNLYMANQYLFKSFDEGRSWTRISPDLTTNNKNKQKTENSGGITGDNTSAENHCTIFTLVQNQKNELNIWVGTDDGNLQVTYDGGKTWLNKSDAAWKTGVPVGSSISCIELSSLNPKRIYVTFDNHGYGDHSTYLTVSNDGGNTFSQIKSNEFTGFAHVIREDIVNEKLLFVGTEMGLFISIDGGISWMRSKYQNIPWYSMIRDMQIHPTTNDLIIATHGRGIYILDDLSNLRLLVKSDLKSDVIFYPTKNFKYNFTGSIPSPASNLAGWTANSKEKVPVFTYYLKERSNNAVKIEIFDSKNKKIKDLNATSNKGLNKVGWNLTINPPKVAVGGFTTGSPVLFSSVLAPKVPVGNYKVVLEVNGKKYEQSISIEPNPEKGYTQKNMQLLYDQGMRLFNLHEKLFYLMDSVDKKIKTLSVNEIKTASEQEKLNSLNDVRKEILELKRETVFYDEFKFRRRVSDIYLELCFALNPFSNSKEISISLLEKEFEDYSKKIRVLL